MDGVNIAVIPESQIQNTGKHWKTLINTFRAFTGRVDPVSHALTLQILHHTVARHQAEYAS